MTLLWGLLLALCAAACYDGAIALQAAEARKVRVDDTLHPSLFARLARRPRWLAAIALDAVGWPFQLGALALIPLTVVQPALALGLVLLLAVGERILGERPRRSEVAGVALLAGGVAVLAASAPGHTHDHAGTAALVAVSAGLGLVALTPFVVGAHGRLLVVAAGAAFTLAAVTSKLLTDELAAGTALGALAWAGVTGLAGLTGKLAETAALQRMGAASVAAPVFAVQAVVPVLAAPALTGEHWGAGVPAGLVLVLGGTLLLARSRAVLGLVETEHA
jgi:drug/metabolite transporter (DMT)-like permease